MDLAKIRQKAHKNKVVIDAMISAPLLDDTEIAPRFSATPTLQSETSQEPFVPSVQQTSDTEPLLRDSACRNQTDSQISGSCEKSSSKRSTLVKDPLEAILAGRTAAGCDVDLPLASETVEQLVVPDYLEFLCFRVSDEYYGVNIMDIKEIIKPRETTEIPRSPSFVLGVISLRGIIIPVIDMLDRLGLSREQLTGRERIIVVKRSDGLSGLLVDEIVQVVRIPANSLEAAPAVLDGIDRDFVINLGRYDDKLIIILNIECIADINLY